jgi:polysaccharide chain length determinant protein (PEP-CTERM system associated)
MDGLYEQFRIALHAVWRLRWLALAVAWGLCLLGWLVMALIPNSYEAKARVFVQAPAMLQSTMGPMPVDPRTDVNRLTQTLVSTENLEKAVRATDLNLQVANDRDLAAQVAALRLNIKVIAQQDNVFEITASSAVGGFSNAQNARTAAAVVQTLIDGFVEENIAGNRAQAGQTIEFLEEELKRREVELRAAEQRRIDFETRYMGLLPGEGSIAQRMSAGRQELINLDQQLISANSALASTRSQLAGTPPTIAGLAGEGGASGQLASLEAQLSQLRARGWTESHPDIVATKAQMARLRPAAEAERRSGTPMGTPNPLYVSLRSMLAEREAQASALNARKSQLQSDLAQLTDKQSSEPELVAEQARLTRDYDVLKRQYDKLLEDREQVRLRSDVNSKTDTMKFRVIERPSIPTAPAKPNRPLFLTLILLASIGAGIGAAFAKSQLQTTFPTTGRLEQVTGLPVLGSVSEVATAASRGVERQRLRWFAGAGAALAGAWLLLLAVEFWQRSMIA